MILNQDQPDYAEQAEKWIPPFLPTLFRDMWIKGNYLERREVDRLLETQRRNMIRDQRDVFKFD